jgi:UDP-N-acetylmuramyl pentapeptide phosphotransferase/UDP-N-acetylglucosamine-1-phosphate transferase
MSLLFVPVADVVRVTLYRLLHHRPLFLADKNHIHHKLMQTGMNQHQALATIVALALLIDAVNYWMAGLTGSTWILMADIAIYCAANGWMNIKKKTA